MKFPVVKNAADNFTGGGTCPVCKKRKAVSPHSYVSLDGGALRFSRRYGVRVGEPADDLEGFLNLYWHGAHDSGEGPHREMGFFIPIVEGGATGQFTLQFCSPDCLRKFLNDCVNEVERRLRDGQSDNSAGAD